MPTIQCLKVIYYFPIVNDGNIVHTDFTWDRQCCLLGAFARLAARFHFLTKSFLLEVQQSKTFQVIHDTTTTNAPDWELDTQQLYTGIPTDRMQPSPANRARDSAVKSPLFPPRRYSAPPPSS